MSPDPVLAAIGPAARVAILGAGLFGRLLALRLAARCRATLYERGSLAGEGSAGWVAAAMLAPVAEAVHSPALVTRLGLASLTKWPALLATLPQPVYWQRAGTLVVAHAQDRGDFISFQQRLRADAEVSALVECRDGAALAALEPELGERFHRALWLPGEGQLCNRQLFAATATALAALDVRTHCPMTLAAARALGFDCVLDCRGLGAREAMPSLRGVRGEIIRVHAPDVRLNRPVRLLHPRYPLYVAPKPGRHYVIGATEIESDDSGPASVRSALELLSAAYSLHPGFAEARIEEIATGCRPALPDNCPAIVVGERLLQVNGLHRHGFLVAPQLLDEVEAALSVLLDAGPQQALASRRCHSDYPALYLELPDEPATQSVSAGPSVENHYASAH